MTGLFLVFEGGDGAGKTTQVRRLAQWLHEQGIDPLVTRQPGGTWVGDRVRELVLDPSSGPIGPRAEALLYAADKAQHVDEVVRPALGQGRVVVCDRYVDSALAYQGAGRAVTVEQVAELMRWATGGLLPDLTVLLDVDPAKAVHTKAEPDRVEGAGADFHERVRASFLALAEADPGRYLVLPARDPVDTIACAVRHRVADLLADVRTSGAKPR